MSSRARIALIVAALTIAGSVAVAVFAPRLAAAGWLISFNYAVAFPLGSLALLMIHRLTGGAWGERLQPVLMPLALSIPLFVTLVLPVLIGAPLLLSWQPGAGHLAPSVHTFYLNVPFYAVRSLVTLIGCSALAFLLTRGTFGRLIAGLGLVFYAVAINLVALDWNLATEAPFFSTSFGASVAVTQMLAALALAAVLSPQAGESSDLGSLMLALLLGITYIDFMAVLVIWYGDLPHKVFWFEERLHEPWFALAVAAFLAGSVLPIALLLFARVRMSRGALRLVGICVLAGLAVYQAWIVAPPFGAAALGTAVLVLTAIAALLLAAIEGKWRLVGGKLRGIAHGS